jgi:hypothetical protein
MKAFFVYGPDFGRRQPTAVKTAANDTRLRTKIVRVLRAGGADIIAAATPSLTSRGR